VWPFPFYEQVVYIHVSLSPKSIIWYLSNGSDALKVTVMELVVSNGVYRTAGFKTQVTFMLTNKTLASFLAPKQSCYRKYLSVKCPSHSITLSCKVTLKISPDGDSFSWVSLVALTSPGDSLPTIKVTHRILIILFIQMRVRPICRIFINTHAHNAYDKLYTEKFVFVIHNCMLSYNQYFVRS